MLLSHQKVPNYQKWTKQEAMSELTEQPEMPARYLPHNFTKPEFDWHLIGASAVGSQHNQNTTPCQDDFSFKKFSPFAVIAVADGLGSAPYSDLGAKIAVNSAVDSIGSIIASNNISNLRDISKCGVISARNDIEIRARQAGRSIKEFACTIIVVTLHADRIVVAHIGDGAVVAKKTNGNLELISGPGDSEYANEVVPLTSSEWMNAMRVTSAHDVMGIMVFTDGLQRAILKNEFGNLFPFSGFCDPVFNYIAEQRDMLEAKKELASLLNSEKVCNNSDDDKTLIVAVRPNSLI